ncbi:MULTISPECIES: vWA domain-containing protein [Niastella]|uniref:VWA domain-containing protein n=1 Tax=Niastella soli TaxID=2821487 RepID=A0ABS3YSZ5_9BACT|nr:vWA domain-containing protein [Niastella soli]MBO9201031.1 VWA domain-containing protein [Niastella soli]
MSNNTWICVNNNGHAYDTITAEQNSYFCPKCPYGEGILLNQGPVSIDNEGTIIPPMTQQQEDLGLCIMLLDCSGSMAEPAFMNHPMSKRDLIAKSVSAGIFSLSGNPLKEFAYVLIIGFDHEIEILVPYMSIEKLVQEYRDAAGLEHALKEKMYKKNGATDINGALEVAFRFTQQFINSEISILGTYKPRIQAVLDDNMMNHSIPNVRVLLFTDGGQFMGPDKTTLNPSPFRNLQYDGKVFDLLMSAYYGSSSDKDYDKLKSLASKCPRHPSTDQFFLFDDPTKVANLKGLFRMASGASGFCPTCLDEANTVTRDF